MSELNFIHENFHTNIACSQRQMHTYIHHSVIHFEHRTSKQGSKTSDQFIWLLLERKRKQQHRSSQCLSYTERTVRERENKKKESHSHKQSLLGGVIWVYKVTSHCNGNHSKTSLSVSLPSSILLQSILCNCLRWAHFCCKSLLEGAE